MASMWEMVKRSFDTTNDAIKVILSAGSAAIGKLAANDGVDIGDVTVNNAAASGVYVRPGTSASWAVTSTQLPTALGAQGALKVEGVASGTAVPISGTVTVTQGTAGATGWPTKDAGPSQTVTRTYTASADMTTAADICADPASGQKTVVMDIIVSTDTSMSFTIQEETSETVFAKIYLAANSTAQITPRGYIKAAVADKNIMGKASVAGNVAITTVYFSEAEYV